MNQFKLLINITALLFFSSLCTTYAQKRVLTLEEAIQTALNNNRELSIAEMEVKKADASVAEAFGYALPSLDLSANFSHFLQKPKMPFPDFEALLGNATYGILFNEGVLPKDNSKFKPVTTKLQSFTQANNYEANLQLTQVLFNSAVFRGIGASKIYSNLSKEQLKASVSKTVLDVKKAFYGVLLTKQLLEILNASMKNAEDNFKNVVSVHNQGLVSEFDRLQAEVRVENLRPSVLQMENNLKNAGNGLKVILGIDQAEDIDVEGDFFYENEMLYEESELVNNALNSNYSLRTMMLKVEVDDAFIDLDRSEYWPSIAAFGNYSYSGSGEEFKFQNYSSMIVGLSFSINLFNGLKTVNRVQQSTIVREESKEQLNLLKDAVAMDVKAKLNELKRVQALLNAQERNVELAQKAYDISIIRYKEGTGNQLEIQNADIALRQAKMNKLQTVYDYIISKSNLDELLGKVDPKYFELFKHLEIEF